MDMTLDEISKLLGEITQGEWGIDPYGPRYSISSKDKPFRHITMVSCYAKMADDEKENKANARLISAAPTIIRELVEQNKAILARNEELQRRAIRLESGILSALEYWNRCEELGAMSDALHEIENRLNAALDAKEQDDD